LVIDDNYLWIRVYIGECCPMRHAVTCSSQVMGDRTTVASLCKTFVVSKMSITVFEGSDPAQGMEV